MPAKPLNPEELDTIDGYVAYAALADTQEPSAHDRAVLEDRPLHG